MIYVTDLPEGQANGIRLVCPHCGDTFSADRGDYFWMHPKQAFRCPNDRHALHLVKRQPTQYQLLKR